MFETGATIEEINTVRKHISLARGGYLAEYAYPARSASLIFSDVLGDDMEFIASGPTVRDVTTVADAQAVLKKYDPAGNFRAIADNLIETPKDEKYFVNVVNFLAVDNVTALRMRCRAKAEKLGFAAENRDFNASGRSARSRPPVAQRSSRRRAAISSSLWRRNDGDDRESERRGRP